MKWLDDPELDPDIESEEELDPDIDVVEELGPRIDPPTTPDPSEIEGSDAVRKTFWICVIMIDIGLLALSVGIMVIVFEGRYRLGGTGVLAGVLALLSAYRHYRGYRNR